MQAQVINQRIRQDFERLLLECLTSGVQKELLDKFEVHAGYCCVGDLWCQCPHGQSSCALAAVICPQLQGAVPLDRAAHLRLRQLSKCLGLWGMGSVNAPEFSATEHELLQALTELEAQGLIAPRASQDADDSEFGLRVVHMLDVFTAWSPQPGASPLQLSDALLALKGLAQQHQDQRIMELAWATANMLDRVIDGTLPLTEEFKNVVNRAAKLLIIAFVFQVWSAEDEWEYAKPLKMQTCLPQGAMSVLYRHSY